MRSIRDPSETDMPDCRSSGDLDMLHQRPTCLIEDLDICTTSETDMPDRRPMKDLNMLHWRPTCLIGEWRPIEDLDMLHRRPTCLTGDPSKTSTCFIGHQHDWSENHRRPWHAKLEVNMPDWRHIEDRHVPLVTDIPHQRLTCQIGDPLETSMCFICDPSETGMPHWRPIRNRHAS